MTERRYNQPEEEERTVNEAKTEYQTRPATSAVFENLMALFEDLERRIQALEQQQKQKDGTK